ncbi:hypothetical protein VZO05_16140 (plasmid) [Aggregatilineales bacterium SYSU G02658]
MQTHTQANHNRPNIGRFFVEQGLSQMIVVHISKKQSKKRRAARGVSSG